MKRLTGHGLALGGDPAKRLQERIHAAGFASAADYVESDPNASLSDLVNRLNATDTDRDPRPNSAHDLGGLWRTEACARGPEAVERFARRSLVGEIHDLMPTGWPSASSGAEAFPIAQLWSTWSALLPDEWQECGYHVWDSIRASHPPAGWLPRDVEDPVLVQAFDSSRRRSKARVLRYVGRYRELGWSDDSTVPSLLEVRGQRTAPDKEKVVAYLRSGKPYSVSPGRERDIFDPTRVAGSRSVLTDGVYAWVKALAHYVEYYDVPLPDEFEQHARSSGWTIPDDIDMHALVLSDEDAGPSTGTPGRA